MEKKEPAFDYLIRETGQRNSALIPDGVACWERRIINRFNFVSNNVKEIIEKEGDLPAGLKIVRATDEPLPHLLHQQPFNCCSKTAVSGYQGLIIEPRPIPRDLLPDLKFGWPKSKQKGLYFNEKGDVLTMCVTSTRRLSDET